MRFRSFLSLTALSLLSLQGVTPAATLGYWTAEGNSSQSSVSGLTTIATTSVAYTNQTVGPQIYDPITGLTRSNNSAFNFSASTANLSIADHSSLDQNQFTWEFFINLQGQPNSWDTFLTRRSNSLGYQIDFDNSGSTGFGNIRTRWDTSATANTAGNNRSVAGGKVYVDEDNNGSNYRQNTQENPWHHVAMTWDANTKLISLYTDYQLSNTRIMDGPDFSSDWLSNVLFGKQNSGTYSLFMDEVRFSSGNLTPDQFLRAVPEPSKMLLSCLALSASLLIRRRPK